MRSAGRSRDPREGLSVASWGAGLPRGHRRPHGLSPRWREAETTGQKVKGNNVNRGHWPVLGARQSQVMLTPGGGLARSAGGGAAFSLTEVDANTGDKGWQSETNAEGRKST